MRSILRPVVILVVPLLWGCNTRHRVTVDPVEFKPIHLTLEVNITLQRELDDFFDFEETFAEEDETESDATAPSEDTDDDSS